MSFFANHLLSYAPVVNAKRATIATRLQIRRSDGQPCDLANAYQAMAQASADCPDSLLLDLGQYERSDVLWALGKAENLCLEIPGDQLSTPEDLEWVEELRENGFRLALNGRQGLELPADLHAAFDFALIDVNEDRRQEVEESESPDKRKIPTAISGIRSIAQMEQAFDSGATAIVGWPLDDASERGRPPGNASSFSAVSRLLSLMNSGADPDEMEKVLASDPTLAFRLFRYLNSPAFGLSVEIRSFEHAMMMLGQKRMKKWLSLLLATASPDPNLNTLMFASVRRGFLLQQLVGEMYDQEMQDDAFIAGIFSMLDKLFCEPFEKLFERMQIPESVYEALVSGTGQVVPYMKLAQALEQSPEMAGAAQTDAFVDPASCNNMLIGALSEAAQAQTVT